jgi:hypothetical protein
MINTDIIQNNFSIYLYGKTHTGKTTSVLKVLKEEKYDYNYTSIQQIKDESTFMKMIDNRNIMMLLKNRKLNSLKIIVIDNIDHLQNSDKKILSIFIKVLKDKSFKVKHKNVRIIFIGINDHDKKVLELMNLVTKKVYCNKTSLYNNNTNIVKNDKNIKEIVQHCLHKVQNVETIYNEKTIISLCYHENIINYIQNNSKFYENFLNNFTEGDFYDRLSFQKQLWQFNEMTFYIKMIDNHYLFLNKNYKHNNDDIIFTKVLTKYSNEYSNMNFLINICNKLNIQKEELYNYLCLDIQNNLTNIEKKRATKLIL